MEAKDHPTPRITLWYQRFSIGNVDGSAVPLEALHLDLHPLSFRWVRGGFEMEGGRGKARTATSNADAKYGMLGVNAGVQIPGRLTPFVEGRLAGGVLSADVHGTVTLPSGASAMGDVSGATWMYARGLDGGVALYVVGRAYLSLALGWVRTTWGSPDFQAVASNGGTNLTFNDVTHDSFLFKAGLGI